MSDINLKNCPDEFFDNCKNAFAKCVECSAGEGKTDILHYKPIQGKKENHPEFKRKKEESKSKKKSQKKQSEPYRKRTRKALQKEDKVRKKIEKTLASGRLNQDGDYQILRGKIQADHKARFNSSSFSLSYEEYQKGKKQGTNCWIITNQNDESVAVLPLELFNELIGEQSGEEE